jgi:hypothetical protein
VNTTDRFGITGKATTVTFANYAPRLLQVEQSTVFNRPLGRYLAVGVHVVHISFYGGSGPEVWLK